MPVILTDDDQLAEAFSKEAIFRATMHYPNRKDYRKRRRLAAWFSTRSLVYEVNNSSVADVYSRQQIELLDEARSVEDLGGNLERLHRKGFFAAHWLRYRL